MSEKGALKQSIVNVRLVTPQAVIEDAVIVIEAGRLLACGPAADIKPATEGSRVDAGGCYAIPGFIDIHCHGGGGHYVHEAPETVIDTHLRHGTTGLVGTMVLLEREALLDGVRALAGVRHPALIGLHLEGPFLSTRYGAKREMSRLPDPGETRALLDAGGDRIKIWTFAPELEGADVFLATLVQRGIVPSAGHTEADARRIFDMADRGLKLGCHLMCATGTTPNAMGGVREVGVDEAVMLHDAMYAEVIPDSVGVHVRPLMLKLILKVKGVDRTVIITDAVKDAGLAPTGYRRVNPETLGPEDFPWSALQNLPAAQYLNVENKPEWEIAEDINVSPLGRLSGSKLTMDQAVRNLMRHTGASIVEASRMASLNPARLLGLDAEVGSIATGKRANLLLVSERMEIDRVMLDGCWVDC